MKPADVRREDRRSHPTEAGFIADGKRNVPPERDVEPTILSPAELCGSIHLERQAMQPHCELMTSTRTTHAER
jgi:hypothetical protein